MISKTEKLEKRKGSPRLLAASVCRACRIHYDLISGLPRPWGGPRKFGKSCNGLASGWVEKEPCAVSMATCSRSGPREVVATFFLLNPNARELISVRAIREYHHSRERCMTGLGSGETGHHVGTHASQKESHIRHREKKKKQKKGGGMRRTSAGKERST